MISSPQASVTQTGRNVAEFHRIFGSHREPLPTLDVGDDVLELRERLLREEFGEYLDAITDRNLVEVADALADLVYVAYGAAVAYGIDLDAVLAEVHRSNLTKLDADGRPIVRADGKMLKSELYEPPDVAGVLAAQQPLFNPDVS
jgi:predicted HAD superfamily Cof-like phosphohydrolase